VGVEFITKSWSGSSSHNELPSQHKAQTKAASQLLLAQRLTIELPRLNRGDRGVRSPLDQL
jgi:hypothetical protein